MYYDYYFIPEWLNVNKNDMEAHSLCLYEKLNY